VLVLTLLSDFVGPVTSRDIRTLQLTNANETTVCVCVLLVVRAGGGGSKRIIIIIIADLRCGVLRQIPRVNVNTTTLIPVMRGCSPPWCQLPRLL